MIARRFALGAAVAALAALALFHRAPQPAFESSAAAPAARSAPFQHRAHQRPAAAGQTELVYVVGAVARPGLYHVAGDARVVDAVAAAGGLTRQADPIAVNLAAFVRDGDEVIVARAGQALPGARARTHRARKRRTPVEQPAALDVNAAGADDLAAVPGIGRAIAQRIVELRERVGPFDSLDELLDVAGMTDARLERARPFLKPP